MQTSSPYKKSGLTSLALGLSKCSTVTIIQVKELEELNKQKVKEEEDKHLQSSLKKERKEEKKN